MLETGANPNIQLKRRPPYRDVPQDRGGDGMLAQGATPLLRAARGGDDKFVALLLKHKALVDLPSKEGITPLMAAAGVDFGARATRGRNRTDEGVLATMDLLIKAGANINAKSLTEPRAAVAVVAAVVAVARGGGAGARSCRSGGAALLLVAVLAVVARPCCGGGAALRCWRAAADLALPASSACRPQSLAAAPAAAVRCRARMSCRTKPHLHGAAEHGFDKFIEFLVANGAILTARTPAAARPSNRARRWWPVAAARRRFPEDRRAAGIVDEGEGYRRADCGSCTSMSTNRAR